MGTRGLFGLRKNNVDKVTYNHFDSYPEGLGMTMIRFCKNHSIRELNECYDKIIMVDKESKPTKDQIEWARNIGIVGSLVGSQSKSDWYWLLRELQGDPELIYRTIVNDGKCFMIDDHDFIKDSLWCEYAYIINLDDNCLEFWVGFQEKPDETNRYGCEIDDEVDEDYYPCKLLSTYPLNEDIYEEDIIKDMEMQLL